MAENADRELLEMAAKAAGYKFDSTDPFEIAEEHKAGTNWIEWNPLTYDGDALRLAVKLDMNVEVTGGKWVYACASHGNCSEPVNGDKFAATRRAIVRAAAEVWRAMP